MTKKLSFQQRVDNIKEDIINRINNQILQAVVPGYSTCRPAMMIIREENFKLCDSKGKHKVMAICNFLGDFYAILAPTKTQGYGFVPSRESLSVDEMMDILNILEMPKYREDDQGKYKRAINPWWFVDDEKKLNELMATLLSETPSEYRKRIENNDKTKKTENI